MKKIVVLLVICLFTMAAKFRDFTSATSATLVSNDLVLLGNESADNTRKIEISELDTRYLQAPNDSGTTTSDFWSASKIASEIASAASTMQDVYDNSTSPEIVVDSTRGALTIQDNGTPIGASLLEVQANGGGTNYFYVDINKVFLGDAAKFDVVADPSHEAGLLFYSNDSKSLVFYNDEADIALQIGQEQWQRVINVSGQTIVNGSVVYVSGASGGDPTVTLAQADDIDTSTVLGVATHDIEDATVGYITMIGEINGVDTSGFSEGDTLYLSATSAGGFTNVEPSYPNVAVSIGTATTISASLGIIIVRIESRFTNYDPTAVFFAAADGTIHNDSTNFNYDDTNDVLYAEFISVSQNADRNFPALRNASDPDTGLVFPASSQMEVVAGGASLANFSTSKVGFNVPTRAANGTVSAPAYAFTGMDNGGIYRDSGTNSLRMAIEGLDKQIWNQTSVEIGDVAGSQTLSVNDDGVASFYNSYGELYESGAGTVINITTAGTYYGWVSATAGMVTGASYISFTDDATADRLLVGANGAGTYKISANVSFTGSNSQTIECKIFLDGVAQNNLHFKRGLGTSPPIGSASLAGFLALVSTNYIDLRCTSSASSATMTIHTVNLDIQRVSK